jgi:hypothetical protein
MIFLAYWRCSISTQGVSAVHDKQRINRGFSMALEMAENYSVLMFDGSAKNVANVGVGDVLMGPDSSQRIAKTIKIQEDEGFLIRPLNGEPFMLGGENYVCLQRVCEECCELDSRVSDFIKQSEHFKVHHKLCRFIADFAVVPDFFVMKGGKSYEI